MCQPSALGGTIPNLTTMSRCLAFVNHPILGETVLLPGVKCLAILLYCVFVPVSCPSLILVCIESCTHTLRNKKLSGDS